MGIGERITGKRVYFDTNIFIYVLEGFPKAAQQLQEVRTALLTGACEVFTSELTLCELLVPHFRSNNLERVRQYRGFLEKSGAVTLIATSRLTYLRASDYRGQFGLKTPDAIHAASATEAECEIFVTNDANLRLPASISRATFFES
jgi:predicted nucleic acid-binding protein